MIKLRREQELPAARCGVIVSADDFAMTNGISRAIVELADAGRISATSTFTTTPHWPSHATWLARIRNQVAVGLHLNLTLGRPLTAAPTLAPAHAFPSVGHVMLSAFARRIDRLELYAEIDRQFAAFEAELGFPPDHVDGHQHIHVLPIIRTVLLAVLQKRYGASAIKPLVRIPSARFVATWKHSRARQKAMILNGLSAGFRSAVVRAGFSCNDGFSGVTDFVTTTVERDFAAAFSNPGPRHIMMCHPGYSDDELMKIDPVTTRRQRELEILMRIRFPGPLWHPHRTASGACVNWQQQWGPSQ